MCPVQEPCATIVQASVTGSQHGTGQGLGLHTPLSMNIEGKMHPSGPVTEHKDDVGLQHAPIGHGLGVHRPGRNNPMHKGCVPTVQSPVLRLQHAPGHGLIGHGPVCHMPVQALCGTIMHTLVRASQHAPAQGLVGRQEPPGIKNVMLQPPGPVMLHMDVRGSQHEPTWQGVGMQTPGMKKPVHNGCVPTMHSPVVMLQHAPGHGLNAQGPVCHMPVQAL